MSTFVEFLVGNALALGVVGVVAVVAAGIFLLGGTRTAAPRPTRPIATAGDLAESDDAVAVVGTVDCDDPLTTPFVAEPSVAYQISVSGRLGHVATVGADAAFTLTVDGEPVRVTSGASSGAAQGVEGGASSGAAQGVEGGASSGAAQGVEGGASSGTTPVVDDGRHEHRRTGDSRDDFDATAIEALAAHDASRSTLERVLGGTVSPDSAPRDYRIRYASTSDDVAVVGYLRRDADGWTLEPRENESLRYLDPDTVVRDR